MKKQRFTEEQIIGVLKEQVAGVKAAALCRKHRRTTRSSGTTLCREDRCKTAMSRVLTDACATNCSIAEWADDYNNFRPHSSLEYQTPADYAGIIAAAG